MTNQTPAENSDQLAELIRALNHQTLPGKGEIQFPGDVYTVVGNLQIAIQRLPQLLDQLAKLIDAMNDGGHLRSDTGDTATEVANTIVGLDNANEAASEVDVHLRKAHAGLSSLAWKD